MPRDRNSARFVGLEAHDRLVAVEDMFARGQSLSVLCTAGVFGAQDVPRACLSENCERPLFSSLEDLVPWML